MTNNNVKLDLDLKEQFGYLGAADQTQRERERDDFLVDLKMQNVHDNFITVIISSSNYTSQKGNNCFLKHHVNCFQLFYTG